MFCNCFKIFDLGKNLLIYLFTHVNSFKFKTVFIKFNFSILISELLKTNTKFITYDPSSLLRYANDNKLIFFFRTDLFLLHFFILDIRF